MKKRCINEMKNETSQCQIMKLLYIELSIPFQYSNADLGLRIKIFRFQNAIFLCCCSFLSFPFQNCNYNLKLGTGKIKDKRSHYDTVVKKWSFNFYEGTLVYKKYDELLILIELHQVILKFMPISR